MEELRFYGDSYGISNADLLRLQEIIIEILKRQSKEFVAFFIDYDKKTDYISMMAAYYDDKDKTISTTALDGYLKKILEK